LLIKKSFKNAGFCLGEFKKVSSVVATQRQRVKIVETGETIQMTSPDQVLLSDVLQSGAVASVHVKGGTANGTGFLFEIHGTEGDLAIAPSPSLRRPGSLHASASRQRKYARNSSNAATRDIARPSCIRAIPSSWCP
jgi:hypothetical protein